MAEGADGRGDGQAVRRAVRSRSALPNGRAVVGGLLVAAAGVGTFAVLAGGDPGPPDVVVVAAVDLPLGHVVGADDVTAVPADVPPSAEGRTFADPAAVVGQVTVSPLVAGELVQRSAVAVPEDAGLGAQVSIAVDPSAALAGTLEEGELVDVLVTFDGDRAVTEVVAAGARIARLPARDDLLGGGSVVVLLALPADADVLAVTDAAHRGELTLARSPSGAQAPLATGDRFVPGGDTGGAGGEDDPAGGTAAAEGDGGAGG